MNGVDQDALAQLARELDAETDVNRLLKRVVDAAVAEVRGAEHAGVTILDRDSVSTPVATDEVVAVIDHAQYESGQGPCVHAAVEGVDVVRSDDLSEDARWPLFTPHAVELGIHSMLSFHLYARNDTIGALNIYAGPVGAFDDASVHMGALLATHAAVALTRTKKEANLRIALESRDIIGQAKGILMERFKIDNATAFDLLIAVSQHTHRKLRDIAEDLATTGSLHGMD
jgi:transcriptional regulator with GAF, ATPase, and Fis domain